jgi:hypothetical protein
MFYPRLQLRLDKPISVQGILSSILGLNLVNKLMYLKTWHKHVKLSYWKTRITVGHYIYYKITEYAAKRELDNVKNMVAYHV